MSKADNRTVKIGVLAAAGVVALLVGGLAAALLRGSGVPVAAGPAAPPATVPAPHPCDLAKLAIPCWSCPVAEKWPLRFVTDLDMLAPLGTGRGNAAAWFAAFSKRDGARAAEGVAAMARRIDRPPVGPVLPAGDPLLREAAPWCDQATMRFYPDFLPLEGYRTPIPNLLLMLTFARSWIAEGMATPDFDVAMADFRRVIRLGRLLRQEDAVLINDLVGLACIRIGAEAIYDRARKDGRTDLALLAAVVAGEAPPQKYLSAARVTAVEVGPYLAKGTDGKFSLTLPAKRLEAIEEMAASCPDRRFRGEAILDLRLVAALAPEALRERAGTLLDKLAADRDPVVSATARWCLATPVSDREVQELYGEAR